MKKLIKTKNLRQQYLHKKRMTKIKIIFTQILILAVFLGLWELLTRLDVMDSFITSSPSRIFKIFKTFKIADLFKHISYTLLECIVGFLLSSLIGLVIAIALWWSTFLRRVLEPYIVILNALPKIALGPIIIIWAGTGSKAIIVMTILICVIVTIISISNGFMAVDKGKILLLQSMGAPKFKVLYKVILPSCVPTLISVLKVNVGLAWVGTIMGEYLTSKAGLGYLIIYGGQVFKMDLVMMSTVVLCILASLMYFCVAFIEKIVKKRYQ